MSGDVSIMETAGEIRRQNLERLVREFGTLAAVAALPEPPTTSVYLSMVRKQTKDRKTKRPRQMGDDLARRIETGAGKPTGWMDTPNPELVKARATARREGMTPQEALSTIRRFVMCWTDCAYDGSGEVIDLEDLALAHDTLRASLQPPAPVVTP